MMLRCVLLQVESSNLRRSGVLLQKYKALKTLKVLGNLRALTAHTTVTAHGTQLEKALVIARNAFCLDVV